MIPSNRILWLICLCCSIAGGCNTATKQTWNDQPDLQGTNLANTKFYLGREIAPIMPFTGAPWLERAERQKEENAALAIKSLNLSASSKVADIGAGTGYFTFRLAAKVPRGRVYAVEIQDQMLMYLDSVKADGDVQNVTVVKGSDTAVNLPDSELDLAIMVDVYHELQYPHQMLRSIARALKANGKLLLLEYRAEDPEVSIKKLHKTSVQQLNKELGANGFTLEQQQNFLPRQHYLLYGKR